MKNRKKREKEIKTQRKNVYRKKINKRKPYNDTDGQKRICHEVAKMSSKGQGRVKEVKRKSKQRNKKSKREKWKS